MAEFTAEFELFGSLDIDHSQYSYVAFLRSIEEWKKTFGIENSFGEITECTCYGLKPSGSLFGWIEAPKAPHITTEPNFGEDLPEVPDGNGYELKPSTEPSLGLWMEAPEASRTMTEPNFGVDQRDLSEVADRNFGEELRDLSECNKYDLKPSSSPLEDNIQCFHGCMEEPDAPHTMTQINSDNGGVFQAVCGQIGVKKHKVKCMKRVMGVAKVLMDLQDVNLRENVLRALSSHLIKLSKVDVDCYKIIGFYLYHSYGTMAILLEEITNAYIEFSLSKLSVRTSKRIVNILYLFQCIAANKDVRGTLIEALGPKYLFPLILSNDTDSPYETVRMVSLSVISTIFQDLQDEAITWAFENGMIEVCQHAIHTGGLSSKLMSLQILESILKSEKGITNFCSPAGSHLETMTKSLENLVTMVAADQIISPKFLYYIIRCYILLAQDPRTFGLIKIVLPAELQNNTFKEILKDIPALLEQWHVLLLILEKTDCLESQLCTSTNTFSARQICSMQHIPPPLHGRKKTCNSSRQ